ncbi:hypothetical protein GOODEAATRI_012009 [Goodea atripinnis]|uniref:Uncharacterized protein n=1 Tax=Goodea atripinnis TaxID=208336 RepID=A0ABV0N0N8_9TELE
MLDRESPHVVNGFYTLILHAMDKGFTAGLVRDSSVYAGLYTLKVKVSDQQGEYGIYSLNTTVCSCSVVRNCRNRNIGTFTGEGAIGIILASFVLLLRKE